MALNTRLHRRVIRPAFALAVVSLLGTVAGFGQGLSGITGSVSDSTGALIPGVEVTISNEATGVGRTVLTNETGSYWFCPPGMAHF